MTADTSELMDVFHGIADRIHDDMSETDVQNAFLNEQFFAKLGYEGAGKDLRSEFTLPDNRRPDYLTVDSNDAVTAVYEFKSPGRKLDGHEDQLFHYLDVLKAEYGVLTNGKKFLVYRRKDKKLVTPLDIFEPEKSKVSHIRTSLRKPEWDIRDPQQVAEFLEDLDGVALDTELGREHFYDTFRLEEGSPFADLVTSMMDLLQELREAEETDFVEGAFDFWEATYASEPEEVPNSWETYLDGSGSLRDLMFSLESGHALLARLLLAKATEDHDFFENTGYDGMQGYFRGLSGFGEEINLEAFPVAATDLIDDMQQKLVEGLFQDDIFVWWTEAFESQLSRGHTSGRNRFEEIAQEPGQVEKVSEATKERFSRAVAELFFNVLRFDFAEMEGDLLGDLYQQYFDPETRKALGEFYTPQPVVDYIMDGVEYERGVSQERLIDPACGSGTFLIEAVDRYIDDVEHYESDPNWETHIKNLCSKPRIVGLDVHPFAVLMA